MSNNHYLQHYRDNPQRQDILPDY